MSAVATPVGVSFAPLVERKFGDRAVPEGRPAHDVPTLAVAPEALHDLAVFLRDDPSTRFDLFVDLAAIDRQKLTGDLAPRDGRRFQASYLLYSTSRNEHLRVKATVPESDPTLPTLTDVWPAANWFEREAWDLMGLSFRGHPSLKRLLTHGGFVGHALRKDYEAGQRWLCTEEDILQTDLAAKTDVPEDVFETVTLNFGPSHPTTHGTLRVVFRVDGETIVAAEGECGYLHRCFEKMSETHTWQQVIPYTDRLNYCSPMINGNGYARAVERMLGVEVPPRARAVRVVLSEFSRIMDHLVCIGTNLVDLGALTNFWYAYQPREEIYSLLEACCGARLTSSYARIGGLSQDVPENFVEWSRSLIPKIRVQIDDVNGLITKNRIAVKRMRTGRVSKADAIAWGFTGPALRASGVGYDVRKDAPYDGYDEVDFDVPVMEDGDNYARYLVRMEEMRQSLRIIEQVLAKLPSGPIVTDDYRVALPPKAMVYNEMEGLIYHFKNVFEGIQVPAGESYSFIEGANGELGFHLVSDGSGFPYRVKVRPPCFPLFAAYERIVVGEMISDAVATLGTLNVIAGELDR
ncbi:MAG: NADH-quinone oxidoreductase subunit D [Acidobacteria bacterium]|nr:MAG: NADH-quinone oxidoreductase subunit D [Acidobacteriota bacterium]MCE7957395.1 NADH-quinone oxidoreductase subunit D [Acidobacteria bacterium ACB2]